MNYSCQPVIFVHSHGGMHGRRQRRAHQQTMFDKCAGDEHGRIEIFVRAAILFGEFIIFPFPANRQQCAWQTDRGGRRCHPERLCLLQ